MHLRVKEHQRALVTPRRWKKQGGILPCRLQREHRPADTLILAAEPWENTFLRFQAAWSGLLGGGSPGRLMQVLQSFTLATRSGLV